MNINKILEAANILEMDNSMEIVLWQPPETDFEAWKWFTGESKIEDYELYTAMLDYVEEELDKAGTPHRRIHITVSEVRARLADLGIENSPQNRALIFAMP